MQVQDGRACGSCEASNPIDAGFCWRCLTPFAATPADPAMPPAPGGRPEYRRLGFEPAAAAAPPSVPTKRSSSRGVRVLVGLVAAAIACFAVQHVLGTPNYQLPDQIHGVQRATDQGATDFQTKMRQEADAYDVTVDSGLYGSSVSPDFVALVLNGRALDSTDALFDELQSGMTRAGATIDGDPMTGERGGTEFRCVSVSGGATQASACMWRDSDNVGIVMDPDAGPTQTQALLWETHDAVVG